MNKGSTRPPSSIHNLFGQDLIIPAVIGLFIAHNLNRTGPTPPDADNLIPLSPRPDGDGSNGWIQTGHIPAAG
jgi:hypothetical protein